MEAHPQPAIETRRDRSQEQREPGQPDGQLGRAPATAYDRRSCAPEFLDLVVRERQAEKIICGDLHKDILICST